MPPQDAGRLQEALVRDLYATLSVPAMPIQDAIDLARFLVETTIGFVRFAVFLPKSVGGAVEIASITKHEGFRWVQRKDGQAATAVADRCLPGAHPVSTGHRAPERPPRGAPAPCEAVQNGRRRSSRRNAFSFRARRSCSAVAWSARASAEAARALHRRR